MSEALMAIPFFLLVGELMTSAGVVARIVTLSQAIVGHMRGGLAQVVTVFSMFFSGMSGSVSADVAVLTKTMAKPMSQEGYGPAFVASLIDTESHQWLDEHMNRAERFIYFFYATAVLAAAGLASHKRFPKAAGLVAILTLVLGAVSLGIAGWISRAGGQVSHSEFRGEGVPPPGGEMQMSHTGGGSKSDAPVEQSVVKTNR